jgi:O-antigen ligase
MEKSDFYLNKIYLFLALFLPISLLIGNAVSKSTQLLIIIIFLITCYLNKNFSWIKNRYFFLLGIIWISLLINLLFAKNMNLSFLRNITFIENIFFIFALCFILKKKKFFNLIFFVYLIIVTVVAFDIFFEFLTKKNILGFQSYDPNRISSFLGKELKIGSFMLGFSFISICYYFEKYLNKSIYYKFFGFFLLIFFFISILLTGERANSFRAIIFLFLFILLSKKKIINHKKILLMIIIILTIFIYFFSEKIKYRFNVILIPISQIGLTETFKETQHGAHFYAAIKMFKNNPLFGVGNKNFREECAKKEYENNNYKRTAERCATHPHQIYYEFLSEHGLVGTVIIFSIILIVLLKGFKIYFENKNSIHLASILFILTQFFPLIPSGSFFTSWGAAIFWFNFSILIFYNNKFKGKI